MPTTLFEKLRACLGCGVTRLAATGWVRADDYEGVGVCDACPDVALEWDRAEVTVDGATRALEALGRNKNEAAKVAGRINQRILWFSTSESSETIE